MGDKAVTKPFIRSHKARTHFMHRRSTGSIKDNFRNSFFNRLRENRSKSVDRFRQIVEDYGELLTYKSVTDLRTVLEADIEASSLMRETEVNDALNQIAIELAQVCLEDQGDQHELEIEKETDEILRRLLFVCKICQAENSEGDICTNCKKSFTNKFAN